MHGNSRLACNFGQAISSVTGMSGYHQGSKSLLP